MYIDNNGNKWYKGNLHTHTKRSDGRLTPDDVLELYKKNGYDFIALTDHWVISDPIQGDILQIAGCEYDTNDGGIFHIVAIGIDACIDLPRTDPKPNAQFIIDKINANGGIAIFAHPAWSMNTAADIMQFTGLTAVEIYNSVADVPRNLRGYSEMIVDKLASEGNLIKCVASDDTHYYDFDPCRGFVWVKADELTQDSIITAIRNGDFIASQAPFFEYIIDGDTIKVNSTPAEIIAFMSNNAHTGDRTTYGSDITHAEYLIKPSDKYVRIQVVDKNGKNAWSSPLKIR